MQKVYILSGLGADERVFANLALPGFELCFIKWIQATPGEELESYAARLKTQIDTPDPVLIGLSFGGIMAIEIAKQITVKKIILLSSVKTMKELPLYYRLAGKLGIDKVVPGKFFREPGPFLYRMFGLTTSKEKKLLDDIFRDTGEIYFRWAVGKIIRWKNREQPTEIFHIHGSSDHILPARFVQADRIIEGGGHFMVYNRADEVAEIILNEVEG
jgi:pimeloyl-ACP methyl ester carboxylesterase